MDAKFVRDMLANSGVSFSAGYPLSRLTTFRVGGPAAFFCRIRTIDELKMASAACAKGSCPVFVIGLGSNLLADDAGFEGAVLRLEGELKALRFGGETVVAGAGLPLGTLAVQAAHRSMTGLEFCRGIPGSVGGALWMNAGAYGTEICDLLNKATVVDTVSAVIEELLPPFHHGYRKGLVLPREKVILSAEFLLRPGSRQEIEEKSAELAARRKASQPVGQRSAGSVFKNPEKMKAWELIRNAGCQGLTVGGARVSEKHANFIVNSGGATADQIRELVSTIREKVRQESGITLETEIETLGGKPL